MNKLYRDLIVKHYRNPFNKGLIKNNDKNSYFMLREKNISCSDEITLQVKFDNLNIVDIKYEAEGCAILIASSSLMSVYLKNCNLNISIAKINSFCDMLQNKKFNPDLLEKDLQILKIISQFPGRFMCVSLPWRLLLQMIRKIEK